MSDRGRAVSDAVQSDPWTELRRHTAARLALGRCGASLPSVEVLRLGLAHAQARDAVHVAFDAERVRAELTVHGFDLLEVRSAAPDRATYLHRPDLGRRLSGGDRAMLDTAAGGGCDVLCVVGDGLSAPAVHRHASALLIELRARFEALGLRLGPVVLAHRARVALGDEIGERLRAGLVVVLVGERPGLSSPDSLGAYLTWRPRVGRTDAERNCVSNIRPEGLAASEAARRIAWLVDAARRLGATGVRLKDGSDATGEIGVAKKGA